MSMSISMNIYICRGAAGIAVSLSEPAVCLSICLSMSASVSIRMSMSVRISMIISMSVRISKSIGRRPTDVEVSLGEPVGAMHTHVIVVEQLPRALLSQGGWKSCGQDQSHVGRRAAATCAPVTGGAGSHVGRIKVT